MKLVNRFSAAQCCAMLIIAAAWLGPGASPPLLAEVYWLARPTDDVIGAAFYVKGKRESTLLDIARANGLGFGDMRQANPEVDMWVPRDGDNVLIPNRYVLPDAPRKGIVLNLAEKRLYFFPPDEPGKVHSFAISIGREGHSTPLGRFQIISKIKDPSWRPPAWIRAEREKEGQPLPAVVPPGPDNPLGGYALRLSDPSYLIHGTNKPWGLGMEVSAGCIRLYPEDIAYLFPLVATQTAVTIVDQHYKVGWHGDQLYLEAHAGDNEGRPDPTEIIGRDIFDAAGVFVDWGAVRRTLDENRGLPQLVGGRGDASANWHHLDIIF